MFKEYKDERINELIKKSFERAVKDDEWQIRYLQEWNILFEGIDKMLNYVNNGCVGELRVNSNMWWVLQETLAEVLNLYGLELIGETRVSENELVIPKKDNQRTSKIRFKNLSEQYRDALYMLARDIISEVKSGEIKRIIKKI